MFERSNRQRRRSDTADQGSCGRLRQSLHIYGARAIVVCMELTTREAAERLNVNQSRVRALVASGVLEARRIGSQWVIDDESVDRQAALTSARASGRSMSRRIAL